MVVDTDIAIADKKAVGTELAIGIKSLDDIIYECAARHGVSVPIPLLKKPKSGSISPDRIKLYPTGGVNDFYDDSLLESQDVFEDYIRLCYALNDSIKGVDVSSIKIDQMFSPYEFTTHNFHPLSVLMYSMAKGFQIAECSGFNIKPPFCRRVKANGLWMAVPDKLDTQVRDYFKNRNRQTSGVCPECQYTMESYAGLQKQ
jgi:hypothetical protein